MCINDGILQLDKTNCALIFSTVVFQSVRVEDKDISHVHITSGRIYSTELPQRRLPDALVVGAGKCGRHCNSGFSKTVYWFPIDT